MELFISSLSAYYVQLSVYWVCNSRLTLLACFVLSIIVSNHLLTRHYRQVDKNFKVSSLSSTYQQIIQGQDISVSQKPIDMVLQYLDCGRHIPSVECQSETYSSQSIKLITQ